MHPRPPVGPASIDGAVLGLPSRVAIMAVALLLAACGGETLPEPTLSPKPPETWDVVTSLPPPGRVERVPRKPAANAVWLDGEWRWTGTSWGWEYGRWVVPPHGATFSPWRFAVRADGELVYAPGTFRDQSGRDLPQPPPLAVAKARDENVTDVEGENRRTAPNAPPESPAER